MEEMLSQFGNYGFPVLVAVYLLIRMENKLDKLSDTIRDLSETINKLKVLN